MTSIEKEDLRQIIDSGFDFYCFKNMTILVTGATGLIGSFLIKALLHANDTFNLNLKIVAVVRNRDKAKKIFEDFNVSNLEYYVSSIEDKIHYHHEVDYIIHGASATGSKFFVDSPVETIDIAITGTQNILEFAKEKKIQSMVYLSSLEVYGINQENDALKENQYGYIDFLSPRSSYSEGKRMVECLCASYAHEYDVPVKIARLTQTFGPGVLYNDNRVFAEFMRCIIEEKNIVLHTEGKTVRNYCYLKDAVMGILTILIKGNTSEAYNIANKDTVCSIAEMASLVATLSEDKKTNVIYDIDENINKRGYNPTMIAYLDTEKIESLGWKATVSLKSMFERTLLDLREKYE